ncbi:MAG: class I tRNA ligase family protein, partial [bacterium]|nr:class I tRNA ligase family protein [bacterium]
MASYDHKAIEKKAQEKWASLNLYAADLSDTSKESYYLLTEFPYPSGDLHIGHWYAFAVTDIYARLLRMRGKNVLFPIGFDAFGLPAENAAIKNGVDPKEWTYKNMERMREQLASMGASFDWSKEVVTCDPDYYKWTQWLFAKLFEHNLAERREAPVKWCPKDQTVLANEQVIDGCCERCGTAVEEKRLTQWFLKITDYAERLLTGLDELPWREEIKDAQRAWIGKSEGAKISFKVQGVSGKTNTLNLEPNTCIEVFTTRPDTIFGATYVVLAPEHPLVSSLLPIVSNKKQVEAYVNATKKKTERERSENKEKTGVKLEGVSAINPATKEEIPIFIADYVLGSYGTGAIMAVPAHDERDMEFAKRFDLPIQQVVAPFFTDTEGKDAVRSDKPTVRRKTAFALVKHWSEEKYLCLDWEKFNWHSGIIGGIEDGEDAVAAATREIIEETGYKHPKFVKSFGDMHSNFYAAHKEVNRYADGVCLLFELSDDEWNEPDSAEVKNHKAVWIDSTEMASFLNLKNFVLFWQMVQRDSTCYTGSGKLINSGEFIDKDSEEAIGDMVKYVGGKKATQYRLRDWLVSRQRYWGCPIPIVYDPEGKPHAIPAEHLPWLLPTDVDFLPKADPPPAGKPINQSPLASSKELKERVTKIFGEGWTP